MRLHIFADCLREKGGQRGLGLHAPVTSEAASSWLCLSCTQLLGEGVPKQRLLRRVCSWRAGEAADAGSRWPGSGGSSAAPGLAAASVVCRVFLKEHRGLPRPQGPCSSAGAGPNALPASLDFFKAVFSVFRSFKEVRALFF